MPTTYISGPYLRQYPAILNELKRLRILPDVRCVEFTTKTASEMGYTPQADEEVIDTTSPDFVEHFKGFTYVNPQQAVAVLHTDEKVPLTINEYIHYYSEPTLHPGELGDAGEWSDGGSVVYSDSVWSNSLETDVKGIRIDKNDSRGDYTYLTAKQALELLEWLEQERSTLEEIAQGEERAV
jgi:hypothetical protein